METCRFLAIFVDLSSCRCGSTIIRAFVIYINVYENTSGVQDFQKQTLTSSKHPSRRLYRSFLRMNSPNIR